MTAPDLERAVEIYVAVQLAVIGVSHVAQAAVWVDLYKRLQSLEHVGAFAISFLNLIFGSVIVAFHDVWSGWSVVVTAFGWANILKAALAFTVPSLGLRVLGRASLERAAWEVQLGGLAFLLFAAWLAARILFDAAAL